MQNVKKYAEEVIELLKRLILNILSYVLMFKKVFCIASTDPSIYISSIVNLKENETALYVRGDDMHDFPSKEVVEKLMPIKFIPYTRGVSSTEIRKVKFAHIDAHDQNYLESND